MASDPRLSEAKRLLRAAGLRGGARGLRDLQRGFALLREVAGDAAAPPGDRAEAGVVLDELQTGLRAYVAKAIAVLAEILGDDEMDPADRLRAMDAMDAMERTAEERETGTGGRMRRNRGLLH
jgi:hypothetical protein